MSSLLRICTVGAALFILWSVNTCRATAATDTMNHGDTPSEPVVASVGETLFEQVKNLVGTWDAQTHTGVMTDIFTLFAFDTAVLGEEWLNGKQITSTVFYVVNGELRADHYCDYKNQPRYTAVPSIDPTVLDFQFRDATNLDTHPLHFHGTQWRIVDSNHLIQDWFVMGGKKPVSLAHMEFTKRAEGAPVPKSTLVPPLTPHTPDSPDQASAITPAKPATPPSHE
jgi:hypothetical protein